MQEEKGALSWTGFLGKLVAFLGAVFLILVILSWLRCGRASGSVKAVSEAGCHPSDLVGFLVNS